MHRHNVQRRDMDMGNPLKSELAVLKTAEKSDGYHHEIGARVDPCTRVRRTGAGSKPPTGRLLQVSTVDAATSEPCTKADNPTGRLLQLPAVDAATSDPCTKADNSTGRLLQAFAAVTAQQ